MNSKTDNQAEQGRDSSHTLNFQAYGVKIGIKCGDHLLLQKIEQTLPSVIPEGLSFENAQATEHFFAVERDEPNGKIYVFKPNAAPDEDPVCFLEEDFFLEYLSSQVRITVAEFAESKVFLHAGAVGWKDSAIIIPGKSYSGKTTLVSELIRRGAHYYSDEYAVLDEGGFLSPYPKHLSMRGIIDEYRQVDRAPADFGAKIGQKSIPVKLILIAEYEKGGGWNPEILKPGEGMLEILQHTIPIRYRPEFVLNVLKNTFTSAIIAKSKRGEAEMAVPLILDFFEAVCI